MIQLKDLEWVEGVSFFIVDKNNCTDVFEFFPTQLDIKVMKEKEGITLCFPASYKYSWDGKKRNSCDFNFTPICMVATSLKEARKELLKDYRGVIKFFKRKTKAAKRTLRLLKKADWNTEAIQ